MRQAGRCAEVRTPQGLRLVSVQLTLLSNWLSLLHKPLMVFVHRLVTAFPHCGRVSLKILESIVTQLQGLMFHKSRCPQVQRSDPGTSLGFAVGSGIEKPFVTAGLQLDQGAGHLSDLRLVAAVGRALPRPREEEQGSVCLPASRGGG